MGTVRQRGPSEMDELVDWADLAALHAVAKRGREMSLSKIISSYFGLGDCASSTDRVFALIPVRIMLDSLESEAPRGEALRELLKRIAAGFRRRAYGSN